MPKTPIQLSGESASFHRFRLDCAQLTAAGRGRAFNEDRCVFAAPGNADAERAAAGFLFAVIDGTADGEGRGRRAANETATSILEILEDDRREALRPDLLSLRILDANHRAGEFIKGRCVATAVWIWESSTTPGLEASWAHIGDTRLYHQGPKGWRQVTRDHARGRLLDRAIGGGPGMEVDTGSLTLRPGERLAIVSAGVWKTAPPRAALAAISDPTAADAVRRLVGQARLNGSSDDTSAIVIAARDIGDGPEPEH